MTDDKVYCPLQNFTNIIVSDMLLQEIDQSPSISVAVDVDHWINSPIESFLKSEKNNDIEDINVIFEFAIHTAAHATLIPLNILTHGIAMRLKARNKKGTEDTSNVMFESTLELIQDISVVICKASPAHTEYVGHCHQCRLYCYRCFNSFDIKGTILI